MKKDKWLLGATMVLVVASMLAGSATAGANRPEVVASGVTITIRVAREGTIDDLSGVVTIRGVMTCSRFTFVFLQGDLTQAAQGAEETYVHFSAFLPCDGPTPWSITTDYAPEQFVDGWIVVNASAEVDDLITGEYALAEATATVRLHRAPRQGNAA
jgi:hypothetical protein